MWLKYCRMVLRLAIKESEVNYTRYEIYDYWRKRVMKITPFWWDANTIVYPMRLKKRDGFDVGAFGAVILFLTIIVAMWLVVLPLLSKLGEFFVKLFS